MADRRPQALDDDSFPAELFPAERPDRPEAVPEAAAAPAGADADLLLPSADELFPQSPDAADPANQALDASSPTPIRRAPGPEFEAVEPPEPLAPLALPEPPAPLAPPDPPALAELEPKPFAWPKPFPVARPIPPLDFSAPPAPAPAPAPVTPPLVTLPPAVAPIAPQAELPPSEEPAARREPRSTTMPSADEIVRAIDALPKVGDVVPESTVERLHDSTDAVTEFELAPDAGGGWNDEREPPPLEEEETDPSDDGTVDHETSMLYLPVLAVIETSVIETAGLVEPPQNAVLPADDVAPQEVVLSAHDTAPYDAASYDAAPYEAAPYDAAPHDMASDASLYDAAPQDVVLSAHDVTLPVQDAVPHDVPLEVHEAVLSLDGGAPVQDAVPHDVSLEVHEAVLSPGGAPVDAGPAVDVWPPADLWGPSDSAPVSDAAPAARKAEATALSLPNWALKRAEFDRRAASAPSAPAAVAPAIEQAPRASLSPRDVVPAVQLEAEVEVAPEIPLALPLVFAPVRTESSRPHGETARPNGAPAPAAPEPPRAQAIVEPSARPVPRIAGPESAPSLAINAAPLEQLTNLDDLLRLAASCGASTLYLAPNARPSVRVGGELWFLEDIPVLTASDLDALLFALKLAHDADLGAFAGGEWTFELPGAGHVRCMTFSDQRGPGGVFRIVPSRTVAADQLGLSLEIQTLALEKEGLILVAGPRSSGKNAVIGGLLDLINRTRQAYIVTVQREVNATWEGERALISQREARDGLDDILTVARAALRENPDVLVLQEVRASGLMSLALEAAASGQLVIAGFTARTAPAAIAGILNLYPIEQRRIVQLALAQHLRGVIAQTLVPKAGGGRAAARELMLNTPPIAAAIAEGKTWQLPLAIDAGRNHGMVTMNEALADLVQAGTVAAEDACRYSPEPMALLDLLKRLGIDTSFTESLTFGS